MTVSSFINQILSTAQKVNEVVHEAARTAKTIEDYREILSTQAKAGDLDGIYYSVQALQGTQEGFIEHG